MILPTDYAKPSNQNFVANVYTVSDFSICLDTISGDIKANLPGYSDDQVQQAIYLAAFCILLHRITGEQTIEIGSNVDFLSLDSSDTLSTLNVNVEPQYTFFSLLASLDEAADASKNKIDEKTTSSVSFVSGPLEYEYSDLQVKVNFSSACSISICYNSLVYSSKRITIMFDQLCQIAKVLAAEPDSQVGKINLITNCQSCLLPDPYKHLDWAGYKGAIHEIFAQNAAKYPDKTFVIECPSSIDPNGKPRSFTYAQINKYSNILAKHLIDSGVVKGDVVMIYATRNVDLVVAICGTLKAGATFSVIDPRYPPERQIVYMTVASPSALLVLSKAGELDDSVSDYAKNQLNLKTWLPYFGISDDLSLSGHQYMDRDPLRQPSKVNINDPKVFCGPDDNPTLSFTSGSEGVPKGVLGRHFSLAYYFDFMADRFSLSETDRFTMLSGIAHDPIQRDIFTPMYLGAQLVIPHNDDILPSRLAAWAERYNVNVTHLTPAMGQILTSYASNVIPSLHHAFFVGDILTKNECTQLQKIARNVNIINMYGTTETQRAVSYFEIPAFSSNPNFNDKLKDTVPAGQGMLNVQLLIINRTDQSQLCAVGEIGEIYVRAAGLAEGYKNSEKLSSQKFLNSWFVSPNHWSESCEASFESGWKGPRDRLYRTGDLGRYNADGQVECCGRADDQIKIRGFRIELGEINSKLIQHEAVKECVTLVRRDKDEEPTLVSYIIPEVSQLDFQWPAQRAHQTVNSKDVLIDNMMLFRDTSKSIQDFLREKLPTYAIPSVIIPLTIMPLNPNGKIDKPALPFPDIAQIGSLQGDEKIEESNFTTTEKKLESIWSKILSNHAHISSFEDDFFEIGGHSMGAARMMIEIQREFLVNVSIASIMEKPSSIRRISGLIDNLIAKVEPANFEAVSEKGEKSVEQKYSDDAIALAMALPSTFPEFDLNNITEKATIFLTGATGFLGAHIMQKVFERFSPMNVQVLALVRAKDDASAKAKLENSCIAFGVWNPEWYSGIRAILGDLSLPHLGMNPQDYKFVMENSDLIIHNGAKVHWLDSYETLRSTNVLSTIETIKLCSQGKPKRHIFVSSTSVLDNDHYIRLSNDILAKNGAGIPESDDLDGSKDDLATGYGQSKWSAEYLCRAAGSHGMNGCVLRPGYILGNSETGVSNTDDFLVRLLKGCIELGQFPAISNSLNAVPVDYVSKLAVACCFTEELDKHKTVQITGHPRITMREYIMLLKLYGYDLKEVDYPEWKITLKNHVYDHTKSCALLPLLSFVMENLPANTMAPELDDRNALNILEQDDIKFPSQAEVEASISAQIFGNYLAYLVNIGFIKNPDKSETFEIPLLKFSAEMMQQIHHVGGRAGSSALNSI